MFTHLILLISCFIFFVGYLDSFLNLLNNEHHLLLGANCTEDDPLMKAYTEQLSTEMEAIEGKHFTTARGYQVRFLFKFFPSDMKCFSGELPNAAEYFSPLFGSMGGSDAPWQPWNYQQRLAMAKKVENFKRKLKDPDGKQRGEVTEFISANKSRQEFPPPLGKYVDCIKPDPLHTVMSTMVGSSGSKCV